jgi:two-component system, OmpR family, sensor kinase
MSAGSGGDGPGSASPGSGGSPGDASARGISLRTTLLAAFAYVLLLVIIVLEVPLGINISRRVDAEVKAEASGQVALIATTAADDLDHPSRVQTLVERAERQLRGRVIVVNRTGRLVADSAGRGLLGTSYASRPEIATALSGEQAQGTRESSSLGESLLFTAVPVLNRGRTVGAVRATQSVEAVHREVRNDVLALIGVGAVALLGGIGIAWLLAGFLSRPPVALAQTAERVAAGDLEARADESGPREQREVAVAFNEMTARLAATMAAQRDFVANASHQLRTPLTGLRLRLEAASAAADTPELRRELDAAEREVQRFAGLLTNLLALARGDERPGAARPVELNGAVRAAAERWETRAEERGQRIEVDGNGRVEVLASHADVEIVLDNLLENAIGYSGRGSRIEVGWGRSGAGSGYLTVLDRGPGLAPGEEERALERFFRGSASAGGRKPGTGLGLAIVRVLAERWGGSVTLRNRDEGGLRAEVRLPLSPDHPLPNPDRGFDRS